MKGFPVKYLSWYMLLLCIYTYCTVSIGMEKQSLLYMPWRVEYNPTSPSNIQSSTIPTAQKEKPCIFCKIGQENDNEKNYVIHKGKYTYIALATQPYISSGVHLLILPFAHGKELSNLAPEALKELNNFTKKLCSRYSKQCNEIHVGFNMGKYAGASIPDHLHQHIIIDTTPRYNNITLLKQLTNPTIDLSTIFQEAQQTWITKKTKTPINTKAPHSQQKCYLCEIINQTDKDKENLIVYRHHHGMIMFNHYPQRAGHLSIVPTQHMENIETMNKEEYHAMHNLGIKIYPLLLKAIGACDINFGFTSYGENQTTDPDNSPHLRLDIIPRKEEFIGSIALIANKHAIITKIDELYENITEEFKKLM